MDQPLSYKGLLSVSACRVAGGREGWWALARLPLGSLHGTTHRALSVGRSSLALSSAPNLRWGLANSLGGEGASERVWVGVE